MRDYELVYVLRPDLEEEAEAASSQRVQDLITASEGQISEVKPWGKRRLAYEIDGHRDGRYTLAHFSFDPQKLRELERALTLNEDVIRYLVVSLER